MRKLRTALTMGVAGLVAVLPGCVELTGQRITMKYDEAADRLVVFIAYDGIHDDGSESSEKGVEQVPQFVRDGDVMLLDWFGRLQWKEFRRAAEDSDTPPAERELARLTVESIEREAVGHYTDPAGRMGALQRIVVPAASKYVRQANLALDEAVLESADSTKGFAGLRADMPRTLARLEAAARSGHRWLALDGSSIRLSFPVHRREWARAKVRFLDEVAEGLSKTFDDEDAGEKRAVRLVQFLTAGPLSCVERDGHVEITFGDRHPRTSRFVLRDAYEPSLEEVVKKEVPRDLDAAVAAVLLGAGPDEAPGTLGEFLRWGPPEDRVRAVLRVAKSGDADRRQAADRWLAGFGVRWNADEGYPAAPTDPGDRRAWVEQWGDWYARMLLFPLEP